MLVLMMSLQPILHAGWDERGDSKRPHEGRTCMLRVRGLYAGSIQQIA